MSQEALSLDISRVVSRVVSGESIDAAERGAFLAAKYPDLGLSGEMIGEAISRAAGMVGMIKSAPVPRKWPGESAADSRAAKIVVGAEMNGGPRAGGDAAAEAIDADIASSIDSEIGKLVAERTLLASPRADGEPNEDSAAMPPPPRRRGPVAALRRAFFGH
jgi:hypothetical protein